MTTLTLSPVMDTIAAAPLLAQLRDLKGMDLNIDASSVERIGAPALQVLLAARNQWRTDGKVFRIWNPSEAMTASFALMGASHLFSEG